MLLTYTNHIAGISLSVLAAPNHGDGETGKEFFERVSKTFFPLNNVENSVFRFPL